MYYTFVGTIDAHNLMHFLRLRMASEAQYEIRQYANAIYDIFNPHSAPVQTKMLFIPILFSGGAECGWDTTTYPPLSGWWGAARVLACAHPR
jgi:hypothetical protein